MSLPIRTTIALMRSAAVIALIGAAPALAQTQSHPAPAPAQTAPAKPAAANSSLGASIEQQITQLHSELKIAPDQEAKWNPVAQAMRDNATNLQKLAADRQKTGATNMNAVDDLETNQQFVQAHLDGLKNFTSAFKSLYDAMSDQQKKTADEVFAKMNRPSAPANHNG